MRVVITCSCAAELGRLEADTVAELGPALEALLVACHAAHPHSSHAISFRIDPPAAQRLRIECLHAKCPGQRVIEHDDVPLQLVGAYTITAHSAHEGHRLRVTWGEREWASPTD